MHYYNFHFYSFVEFLNMSKFNFQEPSRSMSRRDNTIDKFLNSLSRVVSDKEKYDQIGLELGFAQYELDGRWTNAHG